MSKSIMSACEVCQAIDLSKIIDNYRFSISPKGRSQLPIGTHHKTYSDLRSSAASCPSCALFLESNAEVQHPNKPPIKDDDSVRLFALTGDRWPKQYRTKGHSKDALFLLGLNVDVGAKMENIVSYHKPLDLWVKDGT